MVIVSISGDGAFAIRNDLCRARNGGPHLHLVNGAGANDGGFILIINIQGRGIGDDRIRLSGCFKRGEHIAVGRGQAD